MHNDTDWRRESAMLTNQSERGWDFRPMNDEPSLRPWFIAGACVLLFVAMCAICAVSG
jgi:hypothetical protein